MNRALKLMVEQIKMSHLLYGGAFYLLIGFVATINAWQRSGMVEQLADTILGGVPRAMIRGDIDYLSLARWMMILAAPLITTSLIAEQTCTCLVFIKLRVKSDKYLWRGVYLSIIFHAFLYIILLGLVTIGASGWRIKMELMVMISLIFVHICLVCTASLRFNIFHKHALYVMILFLLGEGITFFIAQRSPEIAMLMPGTWAMLMQSGNYVSDGFDITLILLIQGCLLLAGYLVTPGTVSQNISRRVKQ